MADCDYAMWSCDHATEYTGHADHVTDATEYTMLIMWLIVKIATTVHATDSIISNPKQLESIQF